MGGGALKVGGAVGLVWLGEESGRRFCRVIGCAVRPVNPPTVVRAGRGGSRIVVLNAGSAGAGCSIVRGTEETGGKSRLRRVVMSSVAAGAGAGAGELVVLLICFGGEK